MAINQSPFQRASLPLKIFAIFMTTIIITILSPFFILLLIVNFVESPKTAVHLLLDKGNWKPFGWRDNEDG